MNCKLVFVAVCCFIAAAKCDSPIDTVISTIKSAQTQLQGITATGMDTVNQLLSDALKLAETQPDQLKQIQNLLDQAVSQLKSVEELIPESQKAVTDTLDSVISNISGLATSVFSSTMDMAKNMFSGMTGILG